MGHRNTPLFSLPNTAADVASLGEDTDGTLAAIMDGHLLPEDVLTSSPINHLSESALQRRRGAQWRALLRRPIEPPRPLTVLLTVGAGGVGRTPLCYQIAACADRIGVKAAVLAPRGSTERGPTECGSFSWARSLGSGERARRIRAPEEQLGRWTEDFDLVVVDTGKIHCLQDFPEMDRSYPLTAIGQAWLGAANAVLAVCRISDHRNEATLAFASRAQAAGLETVVAMGVQGCETPSRIGNAALARAGLPVHNWQTPHADDAIALTHACVSDAVEPVEHCLTRPVWQLTHAVLERLGWDLPDADHARGGVA